MSTLSEPQLEFAGGMRHVDIRFGLMDFGPFDAGQDGSPKNVRLGIVGSAETIDGTARWIEQCHAGISAKKSRQPNLFPVFPGLGPDGAFRCNFTTPTELQRVLVPRELQRAIAISDRNAAIREIATLIVNEVRDLVDGNTRPDVVLIAFPLSVIERTYNAVVPEGDSAEEGAETEEDDADLDLRGVIKAACLTFRTPIQMLWPSTYDASIRIPRKLKKAVDRRVQDDATRAWNLLTATYYKANGLPWRLVRDPKQLRTSYIGVSFYRSPDDRYVHTSTAQMFDERGEGLILRGGRAQESEADRRPHLKAEDAYRLLSDSLAVFRKTHGHFPARVVMHKTSLFNEDETEGFNRALDEHDIDYADFIFISKTMTRLYRLGPYPPLRGTLVRFDPMQAVLYSRGSVDFFRTYPGMYIPRPLLLRCQKLGQPLSHIAEEVLALTKMNWNNTQFDNGWPITLAAAEHVGEILKYVSPDQEIASRYSFYM